jgi:hypothetical protein
VSKHLLTCNSLTNAEQKTLSQRLEHKQIIMAMQVRHHSYTNYDK